ncbi:MAG: SCP2 sterol-binding domain-containing protein [Lachnospiraceae bacterium]|nr:SCP2 sterol-binding domain-containing protein [Lachnospiraceae bacterium]
MKINIYYGGRGVLDDPTLYVLKEIEKVLSELRVEIQRFNIYEYKNEISTLPQTIKDVDGIILATTVEWLGIGGHMNEFLDACWLYGNKEELSRIYMMPIVMSTTYGEREGMLTLENAWEILGGIPCSGLCGYVTDKQDFEESKEYARIIEKKAEDMYRTISQRTKGLPTSNYAVKQTVLHAEQMDLTPQEREQLSQFVSDDNYVKQQKVDIKELSSMYRELMGKNSEEQLGFIEKFKSKFTPSEDFSASYLFAIDGENKPLYISVTPEGMEAEYEAHDDVDVYAKLTTKVLMDITSGRETFQRAFGVGDMTAKGNLRILRMLDTIFDFID